MKRKVARATELRVYYHRRETERVLVGRLAYGGGAAVFEYDPAFRALGLELSPYKLPVGPLLMTARADQFEGLFGVFDDSLPDGWGRLLLDRHVERSGGDRAQLTPLDRLAWIGDRGMGALSYEPSHPMADGAEVIDLHALGEQMRIVLDDGASEVLERLMIVGGSPQGARPKALVLLSDEGDRVIAGAEHREGFEPYLVKYPARADAPRFAGALEYAYSVMARAAGVDMPATRLLAPRAKHLGYFAIRRFDRRGRDRVHAHTLAGLIGAPPGLAFTSYDDLLKVTRQLTRDARHVSQMFRRAAFNVLAHNRDDHARNFAFLMSSDGAWSLAPAYDVTHSRGPGGEHTLSIAGEAKKPTTAHLLELAARAHVDLAEAKASIEAVRAACRRWRELADEAGVPKKERDQVGEALKRVDRA